MRHAIYPGSFDPLHNGHLDIIQRAALFADRLTVAVVNNPLKPAKLFELDERLEIIREAVSSIANVEVDVFEGLLVAYAQAKSADALIKGLRSSQDFAYEMQMAHMNRHLLPETETLFLLSEPQWTFLSSTRVREVANLGVDVADLVPAATRKALKRRFQ